MSEVSPTVLANNAQEFSTQLKKITPFSSRIQIDLMDGIFAPTKSVALDEIWWPPSLKADIHLMYAKPEKYLTQLTLLKPHLVIVHAEADLHHMHFAAQLHAEGINAGLAVLANTSIESVESILHSFDHLLIFSGDLGKFGGNADLNLLEKVKLAKNHHPELEIGWDGGINTGNAAQISKSGVDVVNAGGFIQKADDPEAAYRKLVELVS